MAHLSNYPWQRAYATARRETDPKKLVARIEQAVAEIETRYAEWGSSPGTKAEMKAIQEAISALQILLRRKGKVPARNRQIGLREQPRDKEDGKVNVPSRT